MKRRISLLFAALLAVLVLAFALVSCGGDKKPGGTTTPPGTTPDPNFASITFVVGGKTETVTIAKGEVPSYTGSTIRPSDETSTYRFTGWDKEFVAATEDTTYTALYDVVPLVEYNVHWIFCDGDVVTKVKENDIPVPPAFDNVTAMNKEICTFKSWSNEIVPLTKDVAASPSNLVFVASYDRVPRTYQVKYMVGDTLFATTEALYDELPPLPETEPSKPSGYNSVMWVGSERPIDGEGRVCNAVFTVSDGAQLLWALTDTSKLSYKGEAKDNISRVMTAANSILYLTYEIRNSDPSSEYYNNFVNRVVEHLKTMVDPTEDGAPHFDLSCNWPYCNLTAAITLCKNTPVIWDKLTADEKERYDFIMECFAYILTLGTDDENNYNTGPGLVGNYKKTWNPNYRLANITPMIFVGIYFGGAAPVDELLLAFDYDAVIAKFQEYGFTRAYNRWTTTPAQKEDGTYYPTPKEFMMNGGPAHLNTNGDDRLDYEPGDAAGSGVGVRTTYTYGKNTLDHPELILKSLFTNNYSGGAVQSSFGAYPDGKPKAYIDGYLKSPYEGELGMMKELAGSDGGNGKDGPDIRSSTSYCRHDFLMIASALLTLTELDVYDPMANENLALFRLVWVGNQDFIFKLEKGYMSYSLGASKGFSRESSSNGYLLMKSWWNMNYGDIKLENFPEPVVVFNPLILKEDYSSTTVNADPSETKIENGVSYSTSGKTGVTMQTVAGDNPYLKVAVAPGGKDAIIHLKKDGGLAAVIGDYSAFTFTVSLAKSSDKRVLSTDFRLRAKGGTNDVVTVFSTKSDGSVVFGAERLTITTLTTEFQEISFKVDFANASITASLAGEEVGTATLSIPAADRTEATNTMEWLDTITSYVFYWYLPSNSSSKTEGNLLIDDMSFRIDAPESPDEEIEDGDNGGYEE